jgi:hypothetical protein
MNRWLLIGSLAGLLIGSTGCLHHNTRGGCSSGTCSSGACSTGTCGDGACGCNAGSGGCNTGSCGCNSGSCGNGHGLLGAVGSKFGACGGACGGGCRTGCVAGPIGWQQGGLNYSSHLQPGVCGHNAAANLNSRPFTPGPPTAQTAYPYYTHRGPRDFLLDNPPTIGQ